MGFIKNYWLESRAVQGYRRRYKMGKHPRYTGEGKREAVNRVAFCLATTFSRFSASKGWPPLVHSVGAVATLCADQNSA